MKTTPIYSWESLPVYDWTNEFARVVGRLLASLPAQFHIYAHNLAGQATVMAGAIAGGHRDLAPGETVSADERRAYLTMGRSAAHAAQKLLHELREATKHAKHDVAHGLVLTARIKRQFEQDLSDIEESVESVDNAIVH